MELEDLKKRLYKADGATFEDRPKPPEEFDLGQMHISPKDISAPQWKEELRPKQLTATDKKKILWGAAAAVFLIIMGTVGWLAWERWGFHKNDVTLEIYGQEKIASGQEVSYVVRYKNNTQTTLENAVLTFFYAPGSMPAGDSQKRGDLQISIKNIGSINAGQEGQTEFKARVLGDKDSEQEFSAELEFKPANVSSNFTNETEFKSTIVSVPLVLSFDLPEKIVSGQILNFSLKYLNTSDSSFSDSKIKIEFPAGFKYETSFPSPSEGHDTWEIPEISSNQEGKIMLKGTLTGNEGDTQRFFAQIGTEQNGDYFAFAEATSIPLISASPLFIEQNVINQQNNVANIGQDLNYRLKYRNTTSYTIDEITITVKFDTPTIEPASVTVQKGYYDSSAGILSWNASSLKDLESLSPGEEGELEFTARVVNRLPINDSGDKNFVVRTVAEITSPNVPLALAGTQISGKNNLEVKINSRLVLNAKGFYTDSLLPNSGPVPPKVGQKTTYTIYWQVLNVSNDLSDATIEASLPSYVQWQGNFSPRNEDLSYNQATGKVVWKIGRLSAGVGIIFPVRQVAFQIGVTPSINQVGTVIKAVKEMSVSAQDNFTQQTLDYSTADIGTDMSGDPTVGFEKGKVVN